MTTTDFRDQEPVWIKYCIFVGQGSDKYYEVRVDMDDDGTFVTTKRWGRRPDVGEGQTKPQRFQTSGGAISEADRIFSEKLGKGYFESPRPANADYRIVRERADEDEYDNEREAF